MNIAHLKYAVEVEKTASITKAAENLFMGQPNLSRGIKELEETLGVKIFKRTSKGIVPTPQGEEFLGYAKSILAQIEEMESLYKPEKNNKLKFSISVPRASYIADAFSKFVREADMSKEIEFSFKETNAMRAIRNVVQENYGLAIVRYQTIFESFFTNMLRDKGMKSENIWEFEYQLLISKNALAKGCCGYRRPFRLYRNLPRRSVRAVAADVRHQKGRDGRKRHQTRVCLQPRQSARPFGDGTAHIYVGLADGCGTA